MKNKLFWNKYRPTNINDLVLLPRVRKAIENGVTQNLILYGSPGCGKTSLSKIITKLYPSYSINASKHSSVEFLRNEIDQFCSTISMGFENNKSVDILTKETGFNIDHDPYSIKIVFLDEFDGVSKAFQDSLRGFIEEYDNHVRFIATINNISKVSDAIKSRFMVLNFNAQNQEEEKYIKSNFARSIKNIIDKEQISLTKEDIIRIVNKGYPDLRSIVQNIQYVKETGDVSISNINIDIKLQTELYNIIINPTNEEVVFHFINDNFGDDNIEQLLKLLGKPFVHWLLVNKRDWISKFPDITALHTKYCNMLPTSMDPLILGTSLVYGIMKIK